MSESHARRPVALVSGASSGIGQACLRELDRQGFTTVGGAYRTPVDGATVRFDTTDESRVDAAVDEIEATVGPIEVVVVASGMAHLDLATRISAERFRQVVDLDLTGAFLLARSVLRVMIPRRSGRVIFVGSAAGVRGVPGVSPYAASKAGLDGLVRTLAHEVGSRSITVNVVAPGLLDDAEDRIRTHRPRAGAADVWVNRTPAKRPGTADEVAAAVGFLASPGGRSITGATVLVDGGYATSPT